MIQVLLLVLLDGEVHFVITQSFPSLLDLLHKAENTEEALGRKSDGEAHQFSIVFHERRQVTANVAELEEKDNV